MKKTFFLRPQEPSFPTVRRFFLDTLGEELARGDREVIICEPTRTGEQNALMWPLLHDLSRQLWREVNGVRRRLTPDEWKDVLTAALTTEQRFVAGIDGSPVLLGVSTSSMGVGKMKQLIDLIKLFGDREQVQWTPPKTYRHQPED